MPQDTYPCPQCHATLRSSPQVQPGDLVQCPKCHTRFTVPEPDAIPVADAIMELDDEITKRRRPSRPKLSAEEDEPLVTATPRRRAAEPDWDDEDDYPRPSRKLLDDEELSREWFVDLSRWFEFASNHWSSILGPAVGYGLLYFVIEIAMSLVPFGGGTLLSLFLTPPLQSGFFVVALKQLKDEEWTFGDFFGGFAYYWPLVAVQLLVIPLFLILLPAALPVVVLVIGNAPPLLTVAVGLALGLVCLGALIYVSTRAFFFATLLILDRNYGPIEAIVASWQLSRGHFWGLFAVELVLGLIGLAGAMLCGVGTLFAVPFVTLTQTAGYLLVAGTRPPRLWKEN